MIIGRGLLGQALRIIDEEKYLFYVNGVSNSVVEELSETNAEFEEIIQLSKEFPDIHFVYISTVQVNSSLNHNRAYVRHKILAEALVAKLFKKCLIIRTTNLVGNNIWNTHTLFNYLANALQYDKEIIINRNLLRNFLDVEHFTSLLDAYLKIDNNSFVNMIEIANPVSYSMQQVIEEFEFFFKKKFRLFNDYELSNYAQFEINSILSQNLFRQCDISLNNYIHSLLKKYYCQLIIR